MHASFVPVRLGDEPQGHASYALLFGGFGLKEDPFEAVEAAEAAAKANHEDEQGEWQDTREKVMFLACFVPENFLIFVFV